MGSQSRTTLALALLNWLPVTVVLWWLLGRLGPATLWGEPIDLIAACGLFVWLAAGMLVVMHWRDQVPIDIKTGTRKAQQFSLGRLFLATIVAAVTLMTALPFIERLGELPLQTSRWMQIVALLEAALAGGVVTLTWPRFGSGDGQQELSEPLASPEMPGPKS